MSVNIDETYIQKIILNYRPQETWNIGNSKRIDQMRF
jgi:hypothetical protein